MAEPEAAESHEQGDKVKSPTQVGRPQQYTDDDLIDELQRVATEHHSSPQTKDIREHSDRSVRTYFRRFGSWQAALDSAGFNST